MGEYVAGAEEIDPIGIVVGGGDVARIVDCRVVRRADAVRACAGGGYTAGGGASRRVGAVNRQLRVFAKIYTKALLA